MDIDRFLAIWGATPRERLASAGLLILMFGGVLLGIYAIDKYRPLLDLTLSMALSAYLPLLAAAFLLVHKNKFPNGTAVPVRVMARAGWALMACFGLAGVFLTANGVNTPPVARTVVCVARRMTRERDEARRTYDFSSVTLQAKEVM